MKNMNGKYVWMDVTTPRDGTAQVYLNHWWRVRQSAEGNMEALCYRYKGVIAPQANTVLAIVDRIAERDGQGGEIVKLPIAYMPHKCEK